MGTPRPWTVLPHDEVKSIGENLRVVSGSLPSGSMNRRMMVAKLSDGRLVFHNAIPLKEEDQKALEAWGEPGILLVPNQYHRLDVHAYKARYPKLTVLCPAPIDKKVRAAVAVDAHYDAFPIDPNVQVVPIRGTSNGEAALVVKGSSGTSLSFADVVMNIVKASGLDGLLFRLMGSVGGPRVTLLARVAFVKDKKAVRAHLEELAGLPELRYLIPSHGELVESNGAAILREVAARL